MGKEYLWFEREELLMFRWLSQTESLGSWLCAKKTTSTQAWFKFSLSKFVWMCEQESKYCGDRRADTLFILQVSFTGHCRRLKNQKAMPFFCRVKYYWKSSRRIGNFTVLNKVTLREHVTLCHVLLKGFCQCTQNNSILKKHKRKSCQMQ